MERTASLNYSVLNHNGTVSRERHHAQAAGISVGVVGTAMAMLGAAIVSWGGILLGLTLCAAGVVGIEAAKPVYQWMQEAEEEKTEKEGMIR